MQQRHSRILPCLARLGAAVLIAALGSACVRSPPPPPGMPPVALPAAVLSTDTEQGQSGGLADGTPVAPEAGIPPDKQPADGAAPVALKPALKTKTTATKASVSSSLGGHDRHLVMRPMDTVLAADFELGALAPDDIEPGLWTALGALENGLVSAELPYELFSDNAAAISRIRYTAEALQGIKTARFSAPRTGTGGIASAGIRVFAHRGGDSSSKFPGMGAATGLVILSQDESGSWRIEHFELDLVALAHPVERSGTWDPYGTPVQP